MHRGKPPTATQVEEARANVFLDKVRATLQSGEFKRQDHVIERLLEEGFSSTDIASALLHHLQSEASAPVSKPVREEEDTRSERRSFGDARRGREDRPPRREFDRPAPPSHKPWRKSDVAAGPRRFDFDKQATPKPRAVQQAAVPAPASTPADPSAVAIKPPAVPASDRRQAGAPHAGPLVRPSRRTPDEQTRLYINLGEKMGVAASDVVGAILGETGLPAKVVGAVDVRERHLFVNVAAEHANSIISKLNRARIKNQKLKVKVA
jgi:ATP-dependent RNA helicase DeaD